MRSRILFLSVLLGVVSLVAGLRSQTPAPIIIQPQTTSSAPVSSSRPLPTNAAAEEAIDVLRQIRAANEETLKKQQAALDALAALQKEADQLKIFAKRG